MGDDCCVECKQFIFSSLLGVGVSFKFATKTVLQNFNNSNGKRKHLRARTHTHTEGAFNLSFDQLFFSLSSHCFIIWNAVRKQNRIVCFYQCSVRMCWKDGFYFPFQYETISLLCICLTIQCVYKSIFGISYAHIYILREKRNPSALPDTYASICIFITTCILTTRVATFIPEWQKKNSWRAEAVILISLPFSTAANVKLCTVCLAFEHQIQFVWYFGAAVVAVAIRSWWACGPKLTEKKAVCMLYWLWQKVDAQFFAMGFP